MWINLPEVCISFSCKPLPSFTVILIFSIVYLFPYMELRPWVAIVEKKKFPVFLLADHQKGRRRGLRRYLHLLESLKWLMSVNKHS